jgi:glycosyltransferase involved in cell wall biosynthesis
MIKLQVVVPCYNEEAVLPETIRVLEQLLDRLVARRKIAATSQVTFVDDGSRDSTWALIQAAASMHGWVSGIKLSRNQGHQAALLAGLLTASGDATVSIDADLQDDVDVIEQMVDQHHDGCDIVYGVRNDRKSDSAFKRTTAQAFYRLLALFGAEVVHNHADFRLMSRRAIEALRQYHEVHLFLRGIVPLLGFQTGVVYYARRSRFAGTTKYPLRKMLRLAIDGVTSFSTVPLQLVTLIGLALFVSTMAVSAWAMWVSFFTDRGVPGWASTVLPLYFLGGVQILCLGILGEYLGKVYGETKGRPRYFIDRVATSAGGTEEIPATPAHGRTPEAVRR